VFFNDTDHVGLYLGNDLFLHAPRTGDVVKVTKLSGYYKPVWGWVRWTEVSGTGNEAPAAFEIEAGGRVSARVFTVVSAD